MYPQNQRDNDKRAIVMALAGLTALLVASCGDNKQRTPVYPVEGKLFVNGKPAEGALVILHPRDKTVIKEDKLRPYGQVGSDGTFRVTTYDRHDGAPAGTYDVTVFWPESPNGPSPDRLQGRYTEPEDSKLKAQVEPEDNELKAFRIEAPGLETQAADSRNNRNEL